MLQDHLLSTFLSIVISMTVSCSGFSPDRSGNIKTSTPDIWNIESSLKTESKVTVNHAKMDVTSLDKNLQISNTKAPIKTFEETSVPDMIGERRFDFMIENFDNKAYFSKIKDPSPVKEDVDVDSASSTPRNVVMIIVEPGQDRENFWKNFGALHTFPIEGTLESCTNNEAERTKLPLDNGLIYGDKEEKHDCEYLLRTNIASLLFWTRNVKGMTTGSLSNANFTIPLLFGLEESVGLSGEFNDIDEDNMKLGVNKAKPEIRSDWHMIDTGKSSNHGPSLISGRNTGENDEIAWNVFDMFSKIRLVLFRSLLESLGGNTVTSNDTPPRKSHLFRSNLLDMYEELRSVENAKGFVMVASVSASELNSALELLQREMSQDTLFVVIGVCSHDTKPVPFFAQGPSSKMLREATTICDVPIVVKNIISNGCQDISCRTRQRDLHPPLAPHKSIPHDVAILRRTSRDVINKPDGGQKAEASVLKEEVKKVADLHVKEEAQGNADEHASPKATNRNSANFDVAEKFTIIFGTIISMVAALSLTS